MIAFPNFKEIEALDDIQLKHRTWLKQYEGKVYSIAEDGKHKIYWSKESNKYKDKDWTPQINCIKRLKNRTIIEFDDLDDKKAKENLEEVQEKLKELEVGFIRSTHNGKCDYLWVEFNKEMKDFEVKQFLVWIAPEGSKIDLNFASSRKVFPILYAVHWKHSYEREKPIEYFEGEQIDYDKLNISPIKRLEESIKEFKYETFIKEAGKVFGRKGQAETFENIQPLFYDKSKLWWLWNQKIKCWEMVDEIDILNMVEEATGMDVVSSKERNEILNALKQAGRKNIPKPIKKTWIQFKDKIYDIKTGEEIIATAKYFVTNPIPHKIHDDKYEATPIMDKIFEEWVGKDYVKTLYEIIAYCLLPDYPIHRLFCFIGEGLNGKTCFLRLLKRFVGIKNITSTELDTLLISRFEAARLHKKLVCIMGETNFAEINKTSIIKKLTGQDLIGYEFKNKDPFEDNNYAKILIATNNLPTTTDKTIGFYRRWCIIDFPNKFSEEKDILDDIPEEEYKSLALKSLSILKDLLKKRKFHNEGTIEERAKKYEDKSNPFDKFWKENIIEDGTSYIWKHEFRDRLKDWCKEHRFRELTDRPIATEMNSRAIETQQIQADFYTKEGIKPRWRAWIGVKWIE